MLLGISRWKQSRKWWMGHPSSCTWRLILK